MNRGPKIRRGKRLIVTAVWVGVSAGLIYGLMRGVSGEEFRARLAQVSPALALACGLFHLIGYLITTLRWKVLLAGQGYQVRYWPLLFSWVGAGFFNAFLPGIVGGDVLLMYYSAKYIGDGYQTAPVVFIARLTGLTALLMICAVAVLFKLSILLTAEESLLRFWLFPLLFLLGVVGLIIAVQPRVAASIERLLDRVPFGSKLKTIFLAFRVYRERKQHLLVALGLSVLFHLNVVLYYYMCTVALGLGTGALDVFAGAPLVIMLMMLPISFGGIGVRGWGFKVLLQLTRPQALLIEALDVLWRYLCGLLGLV
ncbi:MAG TPA: flippase-like domain-containing protein, partial [Armatimonadetes bacterium]|nr:flippase-like domain-containing protein [Armatimonadota bacterium]